MARIAVTGGAGFIGSHLVESLLQQGHNVLVIDDLSASARSNLPTMPGRLELASLDVRNGAAMEKLLLRARPVAVAHLAAIPSVPRSIAEPRLVHDVNINGTLAALEAARLADVRRFVVASSAAVYGPEPRLPSTEGDPLLPASPYAAQKAACELLGQAYRAAWGMETVALRCFNVYGPRQLETSAYSGVLSVFAARLRRDGRATITGDGRQTRDFIYVADVVAAFTAALLGPDPGVQPVNVAGGVAITVRELYRQLAALLDVADEPEFAPPRAGDVLHSLASVERMAAALGVVAETSLSTGLARLLAWEPLAAG